MILNIVGDQEKFNCFKNSIPDILELRHYYRVESLSLDGEESNHVIIDFDFHNNLEFAKIYQKKTCFIILLSTVTTSLENLNLIKTKSPIIGFNGVNGFIKKDLWEVTSSHNTNDPSPLNKLFELLNKKYVLVKDQIGMVSPRILFQILKEAQLTILEGTASKQDINTAMKLGTNYPMGPFEWLEEIDQNEVTLLYNILASHEFNERYSIESLL